MDTKRIPKRLQDKAKGAVNAVISKVVGYERKTPDMWDYYEGESPIDWDSVDLYDPLRLVFQATVGAHGRHGDNKPDYAVGSFVQNALARKRKYGLYHLILPDNVFDQASFYINTVDSLGGLGNMMPIVDVEVTWVRGVGWRDQVKQWIDIVQAHFNKIVLAYTSKYYWSYLNDRNGYPPIWSKDLYYWGAGYLFIPYIDANIIMPHSYLANGFLDWAAWQYWDKGKSSPPRNCPKFPANDLSLIAPWFRAILDTM